MRCVRTRNFTAYKNILFIMKMPSFRAVIGTSKEIKIKINPALKLSTLEARGGFTIRQFNSRILKNIFQKTFLKDCTILKLIKNAFL